MPCISLVAPLPASQPLALSRLLESFHNAGHSQLGHLSIHLLTLCDARASWRLRLHSFEPILNAGDTSNHVRRIRPKLHLQGCQDHHASQARYTILLPYFAPRFSSTCPFHCSTFPALTYRLGSTQKPDRAPRAGSPLTAGTSMKPPV